MQKKISIDLTLFVNMVTLIKMNDELTDKDRLNLESVVIPLIDDKLDRIISHENFSRYIAAKTPEDKQRLLDEYLQRYNV